MLNRTVVMPSIGSGSLFGLLGGLAQGITASVLNSQFGCENNNSCQIPSTP